MKSSNELKIIFIIKLLIIVTSSSSSASLNSKEVIHKRLPTRNCSALDVRAHLTSTAKIGDHIGIIEMTLSNIKKPLSVCYPANEHQHQHAALLSHILCRQIGYMTVGSSYMESHPFGDEQFSLIPDSPGCIGHEQSLSHCCWNNITTEFCRNILGIRCQSCFKKLVSSSGEFFSPGYPNAYFYSVSCEWHVVVSAGHTIEIIFSYFHLPSNKQYVYCDVNSPYIEVTYQTKAGYTSKRYCNNNYVQNLSIPFKEARIRFFSGFYNGILSEMGKNYGMSASFKAKVDDAASHRNFKSLLISCVVIVLFVMMTSWYLCVKWKHYKRRQAEIRINASGPNAPGLDALNAAYEFQRVQIQTAKNIRNESDVNTNCTADMTKLPVYENLPVTGLVPPGPRFRKPSSFGTTPRGIIPELLEMKENKRPHSNNRTYLSRLKTRLLSRFSSSSVVTVEDSPRDDSVFLPRPTIPFEIYRSCSSEENSEEQSKSVVETSGGASGNLRNESQVSTVSSVFNRTYDVPTIVIQSTT